MCANYVCCDQRDFCGVVKIKYNTTHVYVFRVKRLSRQEKTKGRKKTRDQIEEYHDTDDELTQLLGEDSGDDPSFTPTGVHRSHSHNDSGDNARKQKHKKR